MSKTGSFFGLLAWLVLVFSVSALSARYMPGEWYRGLNKPSFNPPGWVFGPVWTVLYTMMAVAAYLVWRRSGFAGAQAALGLFLIQLVLNGLWSWLFFGIQRPDLALIDIIVLWLAILATAVAFRKHDPLASNLLLPYLAWVSFATVLNASIVRLNP